MSTAKKQRVDYAELVDSLENDDRRKADQLLEEVFPRLVEYLQITMGAKVLTAEECVQQAISDVYEQVKKGNIRERNYILSYLMTACRNEYIKYKKKEGRFVYDEDVFRHVSEPAEQIESLIDEDRKKILYECLNELDEESRKFMLYFIKNPDTTTKKAANHFQLTGANVRTRKSRLTQKLHQAYKRKSAQAIRI